MSSLVDDETRRAGRKDADEEGREGKEQRCNHGGDTPRNHASAEVGPCGARGIEQRGDGEGGVGAVPQQKTACEDQRQQRRTAVEFRIVRLSATDDFGILEIDVLIPEVHLREAPDAEEEAGGDQQDEVERCLLYTSRWSRASRCCGFRWGISR